ncbi:hypothetical protein [Phocaeicola sartorii]|uniref:Imm32 family immunity protein n=1 Tax=Phocaeicola sartorii TaxID=671267 RepID=UPI002557FB46|nr:hypothetical protein [Phocaeicola sartorii]
MEKVKIEIEYNEYGCPIIEPEGQPNLSFRLDSPNELYIEGNQDGLRLLAKALLGMAEYDGNESYHIHLDELYKINNANKTFTISKSK